MWEKIRQGKKHMLASVFLRYWKITKPHPNTSFASLYERSNTITDNNVHTHDVVPRWSSWAYLYRITDDITLCSKEFYVAVISHLQATASWKPSIFYLRTISVGISNQANDNCTLLPIRVDIFSKTVLTESPTSPVLYMSLTDTIL